MTAPPGADRQYRYLSARERCLTAECLGLPLGAQPHMGYQIAVGAAALRVTVMRGTSYGWVSSGVVPLIVDSEDRELVIVSHIAQVESDSTWDALNAYDSVAPSLGPIQASTRWGMLQDVLWRLQEVSPGDYQELFGRHGFELARDARTGRVYVVDPQGQAIDILRLRQLPFCALLVAAAQTEPMREALSWHARQRLAASDADARKFRLRSERGRALYFSAVVKYGGSGARSHFREAVLSGAQTEAEVIDWARGHWRGTRRFQVVLQSKTLRD